ncbi:MAG: hypothetical protein RLZZ493_1426 [Bacteroidota bacterium]
MNYQLLSKSKRIINLLIDTMVVGILTLFVMIILDYAGINFKFISTKSNVKIIFIVIQISYYLILEFTLNKTIGKFITHSKVVNLHFSKPNFFQLIIRTVIRFVPFEFLSFINMGKGWHDLLSKTLVIEDKK